MTTSGKYIIKKEYPKIPKTHKCDPPIAKDRSAIGGWEPDGAPGTIWQCDCGKYWEVINIIGMLNAWGEVGFFKSRGLKKEHESNNI